jgi:ribosomal protein L7Ae-like RNA K-turn-binding protein
MEPKAKRQKVDDFANTPKSVATTHVCRKLQKHGALAVGLKESLKALKTEPSRLMVFVIHDKEHEQQNAQLMAACR